MNRLAVFVEGHTEMVYVERLIEEIAGQNKVLLEHIEIRGGRKVPRPPAAAAGGSGLGA